MALAYNNMGLMIVNDNWGFNTQMFLCSGAMERYVYPWHRRFVALAHAHGAPAMLHSCRYPL